MRVRPGAEDFIKEMAKIYEVIIFTASLAEVNELSLLYISMLTQL